MDTHTPLPTTPLPIARYRLTARVQQPLPLPDYAGSLLRGQFGAALRSVACMTRQPACPGCPLIATCPYTRIFEAPPPPKGQHALQDFSQIPNAYVLEPPTPGARVLQAGEALVFHLVLIGYARDQLALVIFAFQRALAQGLTRARVPAELLQVDWVMPDTQGNGQGNGQGSAQPVWRMAQPTLAEHAATLGVPPPALKNIAATERQTGAAGHIGQNDQHAQEITLHIHTPLRLQQQGQPLGLGQLTPRALVATLARRTSLLMELQAGQSGWSEAARDITLLSDTLTDTQELRWFDWTRYSSRQQQAMTLGGVLGRWTLRGAPDTLAQLWPWLWLGQWLHVGKNASMGMGGFTLTMPGHQATQQAMQQEPQGN